MAYMNQERKAEIAPAVKAILKKYNIKGSLSVRHHSTLVLNVKQGDIDFGGDCIQVNPYWYKEHFEGRALQFLSEVIPVMNKGNWDKSDIQSDYFNVGWYVDVNIGKWNTPYVKVL